MSKKCPDCGSLNVEEVFDGEAYCKNCYLHCSVFDLKEATVFDKITASYEALAEKLVYKAAIKTSRFINDGFGNCVGVRNDIEEVWKSTITEDTYTSKSEAFAATVAKLKEI